MDLGPSGYEYTPEGGWQLLVSSFKNEEGRGLGKERVSFSRRSGCCPDEGWAGGTPARQPAGGRRYGGDARVSIP